MMNHRLYISLVCLIGVLPLPMGISLAQTDLDYVVQVGETKMYEFTEFYMGQQTDPSKQEISLWSSVNSTDVEFHLITLHKGLQITVTITSLNDLNRGCKVVYGDITTIDQSYLLLPTFQLLRIAYFAPTIQNKTYWEDTYKEYDNIWVDNDEITWNFTRRFNVDTTSSFVRKYIVKRNWRSGWLSYLFWGNMDIENEMYFEISSIKTGRPNTYSNVIFGSLLLGLLGLLLLLTYKKR